MGCSRSAPTRLGVTWGVQPLSVPACAADCGFHVSVVAFQVTLMVWGSGGEGDILCILLYKCYCYVYM